MAAGKAIIGVLENDTEVRGLIEECHCGKCCEPGDYVEVADIIRWYMDKAFFPNINDIYRYINIIENWIENYSFRVSIKIIPITDIFESYSVREQKVLHQIFLLGVVKSVL